MRDGKTQLIKRPTHDSSGITKFLESHLAKLVVLSGSNAGSEFLLEQERITLGRGPGVDVTVNDSAMSRQHAAIDYTEEGFRIQDLGSTNGLVLDEQPVEAGSLSNGSRFSLGTHVFQLIVEDRESIPEVYELPCGS